MGNYLVGCVTVTTNCKTQLKDLLLPSRINPYVVIFEIGKGNMLLYQVFRYRN